jgi:UDP-N-acetylmuramate dehydrogenase
MIKPYYHIPVAQYTHYKVGGIAREVYFPDNADELLSILRDLRKNSTDYFILGGGSNVLVGDGYWDGAVIITTRMNKYTACNDFIVCDAGIGSSRIAEIALEQSKTGLEFLYLLPGSIGGAIAGNARYDTINISSVLIRLTAVHPEKGIRNFNADEIDFNYKYASIAREGWIICEVSLKWRDGVKEQIQQRMKEIEKARYSSHHFDFPSCGCVFKNDYTKNIQVGLLIDSLGLKGIAIGGAQIAEFHGNFIINTGKATARDILTLIKHVEQIVLEKTGISLEREVKLLGNFEK